MAQLFQKGEHVCYGMHGVCLIEDVREISVAKTKDTFYVLRPLRDRHSTFFIPIGNDALSEKMRAPITRDEIDAMIDQVRVDTGEWIDDRKARMEALARSVAVEGPRVVVFNPLPYKRDAVVEVEMPEGYSLPSGVRDGGKMRFLAKGLPAGGYKTFAAENGKCCQCENVASSNVASSQFHQANQLALETGIGNISTLATLHTRHFTVKFDLEKGGIASLVENATGRELVKQGGHVLGQFLHERFSRNEVDRYSKIYNERQKNDGLSKPGMPDVAHSPYAAITPSGWRASCTRRDSVLLPL